MLSAENLYLGDLPDVEDDEVDVVPQGLDQLGVELAVRTGLVREEEEVVVEVPADLGPGEAGDPGRHRGLGGQQSDGRQRELLTLSPCTADSSATASFGNIKTSRVMLSS